MQKQTSLFLVRNYEGISANLLHAEENVEYFINEYELLNNNSKFGSRSPNRAFYSADRSYCIRHKRRKLCAEKAVHARDLNYR